MTFGNINQSGHGERPSRPAPRRQGEFYDDEWKVGDEKTHQTPVEGNPKLKRTVRSIVETFFPVLFLGGVIAVIGIAFYTVTQLFN